MSRKAAGPRGRHRGGRDGPAWRSAPLLLVALAIGGWVFWDGQRMIRADAHSLGARKQIVGWASGESQPASAAEWDEARDAMLAALDITPDNAALQEQMGDLYVVAGRRDWADQALRLRHFGQAVAYYQKALALRPTDPQTWASLAVAYQGLGQTGAPLHQAWAKALALGPNEGHVQPMLLETALATWSASSNEMKSWMIQFHDNGSLTQRKAISEIALRYGLQFQAQPAAAPVASAPIATR